MALHQPHLASSYHPSPPPVSTYDGAYSDVNNNAPSSAHREVPNMPSHVFSDASQTSPKHPYLENKRDTAPYAADIPMTAPPPYTEDGEHKAGSGQESTGRNKKPSQESQVETLLEPSTQDPHIIISKGGPLWASLKSTVELRDRVMLKRIGLEVQEQNYNAQWRHTSPHLENFLSAVNDFMATLPSEMIQSQASVVQEKWSRLQQSSSHLKDWQAKGQSDMQELTKWEGMLAEEEEELYHQFRQMIVGPNFHDMSGSSASECVSTINYERLSESSGDPLEQDYYDKVGDLHLIREHIFNVDADQSRRNIQREMAIRSGDYYPRASERQSYEQYVTDRQELVREYIEKKAEMEHLKEICHLNDLRVSTPDLPPFLDLSRSNDRPATPPLLNPLPKIKGNWNPDRFLMFGGLDKKNRILDWQDKVWRAMKGDDEILRAPSKVQTAERPQTLSPPAEQTLEQSSSYSSLISLLPAEEPVNYEEAVDLDETTFNFGDIQDGNPPARRYSEPKLGELLRAANLTPASLETKVKPRSESGIDDLKVFDEGQPDIWPQVKPLTASERQKFQPKRMRSAPRYNAGRHERTQAADFDPR